MEVTKWLKPLVSVSRIGDSASVQAATRVNAEQSSRQTKGAVTDMFYLTPPRHISALQIVLQKSFYLTDHKFSGP